MLSRCSERYAQMSPRRVQYPGCNSLSENNSLYFSSYGILVSRGRLW
jgi:hypothetical protein